MIPRRAVILDPVDITDFLGIAVESLDVGEVLMSSHFTLADTLPAIQIMTKKMDSGMALAHRYPFKTRKEDVSRLEISTERAQSVMDLLFGHLMLWLQGAPLHSTVFSCVYIHALQEIPHSELKMFCDSLLYFISEAMICIRNARVGFDEDISLECLGPVHLNIPKFYESGILSLEHHLLEEDHGDPEPCQLRLTLLYLLCGLVTNLNDEDMGNSQLSQILTRLDECIHEIQKSSTVTTEIHPGALNDFDLGLNCEYTSQVPLCDLKTPSITSVLQFFTNLRQKLVSALAIQENANMQQLLPSIRHLMENSSTWNILNASTAHQIMFGKRILGRYTPSEALLSWLEPVKPYMDKALVDERTTHVSHQLLQDLVKIYDTTAAIFFMNKGRQRRRLKHILTEWERFQQESESADTVFYEHLFPTTTCLYPLALMVYNMKLNLLIVMYQLGFELDLYHPNEYGMVFWYLGYLCQTQRHHLDRIQEMIPRISTQEEAGIGQLEAGWKLNWLDAMSAFYRGMLKVTTLLRRLGYLIPNSSPLYNEKVHYQHRFDVLEYLSSPEILKFEEYQRAIDSEASLSALQDHGQKYLEDANQHLVLVKAVLDRKREILSADSFSLYSYLENALNLMEHSIKENQAALKKLDLSPTATDINVRSKVFDPVRQRILFTLPSNSSFPILVSPDNLRSEQRI